MKLNIVSKNDDLFNYCGAYESLHMRGGMKLRTLHGRGREYLPFPKNINIYEKQENENYNDIINIEKFDDIIPVQELICRKYKKSPKSPKRKKKRTKKKKKKSYKRKKKRSKRK